MIPIEIEKTLRENGLTLEDGRGELLERYVALLLEWNEKINLISRKGENVWESHILHSLAPLMQLKLPPGLRVLDLGTGGGLPGIPMAILHGEMEVTLLDSIGKKMKAVEEIVASLGLKGVRCVTGRGEEVGVRPKERGRYDMVVARGVAPLIELVRWSRPFLRKVEAGSEKEEEPQFRFPYLLALKGGDLEEEIRQARIKSGGGRSVRAITAVDIVFRGSSRYAFEGKKLVVVEFA